MRLSAALVIAVFLLAPATQAGFDFPDGFDANWSSTSTFGVPGQSIYGTVDFALYDTSELDVGFDTPGNKRYLYAYQIQTAGTDPEAILPYFILKGIGSGSMTSNDQIGYESVDDGIDPTSSLFNDNFTEAYFHFADGILAVGEKTALLLLGSDYLPVMGSYSFEPEPGKTPVPGNPVPEPTTLAILLGGSLLALRKRQS